MPQSRGLLALKTSSVRSQSALMSDRLATLLIFALIGSACFIVAAAPHLTAYSTLVTWAAKLIT
jgi:hypothetical protein